MKIVILDGLTTNPGDVSWAPLEALGTLTVYDRSAPDEVVPRAEVLRPGLLVLPVRGAARYFGSEQTVAERLVDAVGAAGPPQAEPDNRSAAVRARSRVVARSSPTTVTWPTLRPARGVLP